MRITLLTVGSRGDVQPFIALGIGLARAGHAITVATDDRFHSLVREHGLEFASVRADYHALSQSEEGKKVLRGSPLAGIQVFRKHIVPMTHTMLEDTWSACQDAEAIVYHPKAFGGFDVAEKLGVPLIGALLLPLMTPTSRFPHLGLHHRRLGGFLNKMSYALNRCLTVPFASMRNRWRRQTLGLPGRPWFADETRQKNKPIPMLYAFSEHIVPRPDDWPDWTEVTGYWFLDRAQDWQPPADLVRFLDAGPPPVYVGFGSMTTKDPEAMTNLVVTAIRQSNQRAILATGWGGLTSIRLPETVHVLDAVPHDWLFSHVNAVVHHGGAGTTAAGLRAGKPTLICPFFADQPFWAKHVEKLQVGPPALVPKRLSPEAMGEAIREMVTNEAMCKNAERLGQQIREEGGVKRAVEVLEHWLTESNTTKENS